MPLIAEQIGKMDMPNAVKQGLAQVAAAALGVAVGGTAAAVNVEANNRQIHENRKAKEKTLAKQLADQSNGQYTQAQLEDALRSANNKQLGETASSGAIVPYDAAAAFHIYDSTGMILGRAPDGAYVLMQDPAMLVPPSSDLQTYIKNNTDNTYSWNNAAPQLSATPSSALPSIMNGIVTPEMLASRQNNAADFASWVSTQSVRFSSAATAYGTYLASQPNAVLQTGAAIQFGMAGTATVVGFSASALEQLLRPNVGQTWVSGGVDIFTGSLGNKFPLLSPALTELGGAVKDSTPAINLQNAINSKGKK
jgi:filamentous hemagglutinin